MDAIPRLVVYVALIISTMVVLDWFEARRYRTGVARRRSREELNTRVAGRSREQTEPPHRRRTAA